MADQTPSQPEAGESRTVPLGDLLRYKKGAEGREVKLKAELAQAKEALAQTQSELQIRGVDVEDDEDVSRVKKYLLEQEKGIRKERAKLNADLASYEERAKEARIQSLTSKYGVDIETISGEEDPEKKALELYAERLSREKEELTKKSGPGAVFESGTRGGVRTSPKDMTPEEFTKHVKALTETALSQR